MGNICEIFSNSKHKELQNTTTNNVITPPMAIPIVNAIPVIDNNNANSNYPNNQTIHVIHNPPTYNSYLDGLIGGILITEILDDDCY
tara:strand:- start:2187 stop:2447 length:261 start_codon:yes stop_codon:yes gene_type:complete